jgi:uncharacterized protein
MILPDVNVLVFAFQIAEPRHATYHRWLTETANGPESIALCESTITGFLRIVTNRRVYANPASIGGATAFVDALTGAPGTRWIGATVATWNRMVAMTSDDRQIRANLVPDAWLAALAISHGARLATADRGMARYPGLDWFDPGV